MKYCWYLSFFFIEKQIWLGKARFIRRISAVSNSIKRRIPAARSSGGVTSSDRIQTLNVCRIENTLC